MSKDSVGARKYVESRLLLLLVALKHEVLAGAVLEKELDINLA